MGAGDYCNTGPGDCCSTGAADCCSTETVGTANWEPGAGIGRAELGAGVSWANKWEQGAGVSRSINWEPGAGVGPDRQHGKQDQVSTNLLAVNQELKLAGPPTEDQIRLMATLWCWAAEALGHWAKVSLKVVRILAHNHQRRGQTGG